MNTVILRIGYKSSEMYLMCRQSWVSGKFETWYDSGNRNDDKELEKLFRDYDKLSQKYLNILSGIRFR